VSEVIQLASASPRKSSSAPLDHRRPAIRTDAIYVVFTSIDDTLAAVRIGGELGKAMGVPLTLIHFRAVPFQLPVDAPNGLSPVETEAFVKRVRAEGLDLRVRVYLCRDERRAIPFAFKPHSLIVVAGRQRWWPRRSERWRRMLEAAGHFVVFVDTSDTAARCMAEENSDA
jgi:hypothetical protein